MTIPDASATADPASVPAADVFDPAALAAWEARCAAFARSCAPADAAHDDEHLRRVVTNARRLAQEEGARLEVVLPAAWLHDCVAVAKDSPDRPRASRLAAEKAVAWLAQEAYPAGWLPAIGQAIAAHSFSAGIPPESIEARVVQDADRLDALGAVGIARCLVVGGQLGRPLYCPAEPLPQPGGRPVDDLAYTLDHFPAKLFTLAATMQTAAGRAEAERRTAFMRGWVEQLLAEIPPADTPSAG